MHKVSEGKLNLMIESTDLAIAEGQFGVVLCADDVADALAELLDRRAADTMRPEWHRADEPAEREQAEPDPDSWPLGWTFVQSLYHVIVLNSKGVPVASMPIQQEAAPEPRKPAKWERQLREMGGVVEYNRDTGQYEAAGEGVKWYCADTAKAAIAAAWKAWKEARGDA